MESHLSAAIWSADYLVVRRIPKSLSAFAHPGNDPYCLKFTRQIEDGVMNKFQSLITMESLKILLVPLNPLSN
ncbi:unnamed protein product, partial [Sphenostylis stenocarpa]